MPPLPLLPPSPRLRWTGRWRRGRANAGVCRRLDAFYQAVVTLNVFMNAKLLLKLIVPATFLFITVGLPAQETRTNAARLVFRDRIDPNWFADAGGQTNRLWYRLD